MKEIRRLAPNIVDLLSCVIQICTAHGGSVTSWYRSAKHNASVGGREQSNHLCGCACDVVYNGMGVVPRPPLSLIQATAALYDVRVIREQTHDHFECTQLPLRMFF